MVQQGKDVPVTSREEAERLLSSLREEDLVEIGPGGEVYEPGKGPEVKGGKPVPGISDQKGEYHGPAACTR